MGYSGVVVALTMLRAFYTISDLWDPPNKCGGASNSSPSIR